MVATLSVGDRVTWDYEPRKGDVIPVPGVVVQLGRKLVRVRLAQEVHPGWWRQVERWVRPEKLRPRAEHVPQVDGVEEG